MSMTNCRGLAILALATVALWATAAQAEVTFDWASVGNPGNAADTRYDSTGFGSVTNTYRISKYEVTAGQYTEFLNAVAATDDHELYNSNMWSDAYGCKIQQSGSSGSYTYSVAGDYANRPVNYVSWYDTLRFANWLHNDQPSGGQTDSTTEDGAYDMSLGSSAVRKSGAQTFLPTEDEWYKAAYHKNDGVTGNYFDYPTSNDAVPSNDLVEPTDPGNNATFWDSDHTIGSPYYRTEVGAHENSESPYGTFDQGGNVSEWNETDIFGNGSSRGSRGSSFDYGHNLHASARAINDAPVEHYGVGFRVASIPEPGTITLLVCGLVAGLIWWRRRW